MEHLIAAQRVPHCAISTTSGSSNGKHSNSRTIGTRKGHAKPCTKT